MIKKYLTVIIFFSFSMTGAAQSLSVTATDNSASNNPSTFNLENGKVSLGSNQISFLGSNKTLEDYLAYGVSASRSVLAVLNGSGTRSRAIVFNSLGDTLSSFDVTKLSSDDPSIAVYPANTGAVLVRDNIASFNFYDSFGEIITHLSGSSQSKGGESISEVAMSSAAETIVIYTPKIKRGDKLGSQAKYVDEEMNLKSLFFSTERYIKNLRVSENGQFVVFITSAEGADDKIHITDRYGNEIAAISSDENLRDARLSGNAEYVTVFSGKRVLIYNTMTSVRVGSTSFRAQVVEADYFPADNTILAMTGDYTESTGIVNNAEFHAIDVKQREVARKDYGSTIGFDEAVSHSFVRLAPNRYQLTGANKKLELLVSF